MKKTTRSLLLTSLILFCSGLLLSLVFSLVGKINGIKIFDFEKKASTIETVFLNYEDVLKNSPDSNYVKKLSKNIFTRIDVSSYAGDVIIVKSKEEKGIFLEKTNTNNITYKIIGDTLTIKETEPVGIFGLYISESGFSFRGLRHIFSSSNKINSAKKITVYVPENIILDKVEILSSIGKTKLDGITAPEVNISSNFGSVKIVNTPKGQSKFVIRGNFTDVDLENNYFTSCAASTKFGSIEADLPEHEEQSNIFDLWCGSVKVKTKHAVSDYKLSISSVVGNVSKNNKTFGKKVNDVGKTSSRISSSIFIGDFSIDSDKKDDAIQEKEQAEPETIQKETSEIPMVS